jgi:hypothetical protein
MACDFVGHPVAAQAAVTSKQIAQFQADFGLDPARRSLVVFARISSLRNKAPFAHFLQGRGTAIFCRISTYFSDLAAPELPYRAARAVLKGLE